MKENKINKIQETYVILKNAEYEYLCKIYGKFLIFCLQIKEFINRDNIDKLFYDLYLTYGSDIEPFSSDTYYEASGVESLLEDIKNLCDD